VRYLVFVPVTLAVAVSAPAQTTKVTSPAGYETKAGEQFSTYNICRYPKSRWQLADANYTGKGRKTLKQVTFRLDDNRSYAASSGTGRSWSRVILKASDCEYASVSATFASNPRGTQTTVFSASLNVVTKTGTTTSAAQPFDAVNLPFATNWVYSGTNDLLLDFDMSGGTLANNAAWSSTLGLAYHLDAIYGPEFILGGLTTYGSRACVDSGQLRTPYCYPVARTFAKNMSNSASQDKFEIYTYSYFTAPNALVIQALTFFGNTGGVKFPGAVAPCDDMFLTIGAASPAFIFSGITSNNSLAHFNTLHLLGYFPYMPVGVGLELWAQAAWNDSGSSAIKLTRAGKTTLLAQPPDPIPDNRKSIYHFDNASTVGFLKIAGRLDFAHNAVYELGYQ